jgi:O-antigen/teichoic acid export membrane protein
MSVIGTGEGGGNTPTESGRSDGTAARQLVTGASVLAVALIVTNAGNYVLNLLLGRWLSPAEFADASLMVTLMLTFASISVCLALVTARFIGIRDAAGHVGESEQLARRLRRVALSVGIVIAALLAAGSPWWRDIFHTGSAWIFVILAGGIPFYLQCAVGRGTLQGRLRFVPLAATFLVEMAVRLSVGSGLVLLGMGVDGATAGLALSLVAAWATVMLFRPSRSRARRPVDVGPVEVGQVDVRPVEVSPDTSSDLAGVRAYAAFVSVLLVGQMVINNSDVLIAKASLAPFEAGLYSAVALIGRAVFFLSWSVATVVFPVVAVRHARGESGQRVLAGGIVAVLGIGAVCVVGASLFGGPVLGLVLGPEYSGLSGSLAFYALATTLFAVACLIASQHLATGRIRESWVVLAGAGLQIVLLLLWHNSIAQLIAAQLVTMSVLLVAVVISHFAPYRGSALGQPVADGPNPNIAKVA